MGQIGGEVPWKDAGVPSDRTTVTELGTGLGMLGLPAIDQAIGARSEVMHSLSPEMWQHLAQLRGRWRVRHGVPCGLGERPGLSLGRRRPPRPAAPNRGVEGHRARAGRRGGADRPAGGPRLSRELQVPLGHLVQRVTGRRVRLPVDRRPEPAGRGAGGRVGDASGDPAGWGRLVRRGGAGRVPGSVYGGPGCGGTGRGGGSGAAGRGHERGDVDPVGPWRQCAGAARAGGRRSATPGRGAPGVLGCGPAERI